MPKIRLTHYCNLEKAKGKPGDIVDAPAAIAKRLLESGGAEEVKDKPKAETATKTE